MVCVEGRDPVQLSAGLRVVVHEQAALVPLQDAPGVGTLVLPQGHGALARSAEPLLLALQGLADALAEVAHAG